MNNNNLKNKVTIIIIIKWLFWGVVGSSYSEEDGGK